MLHEMLNFIRFLLICFVVFILAVSAPIILQAQTYEEQINSLSATMAKNIEKSGKKQIAVVDFTDLEGHVTALGRFIAEEFSVALLNTGSEFEVVDRTHLQTILKEHKLSTTGIIDPQTARKLGQIAGVEALITGTLTPFGESIRVTVKILDVNTAKVIGASAGNISQTPPIIVLRDQGIATPEMSSEPKETSIPPTIVTTPTPRPIPQANQVVESKGFTFTLQECNRSGKNVTCQLLITSNSQDRELGIEGYHGKHGMGGKSRIFDDLGNEYLARQVDFSNKSGENYVKSFLVAGIPTKAIFHFEDFSTKARMITLLEISCEFGDDFKIQFRNIPLEGTPSMETKTGSSLTEIQQSVQIKGLTIDLHNCSKTGGDVTCNFWVTSTDQDRRLTVYAYNFSNSPRSKIFDDYGNEYLAKSVQFGSQYDVVDSKYPHSVDNSLVVGIPMKASLKFEGVSPQAEQISLLVIGFYDHEYHGFSVKLRNITFSK